MMPSISVIVPVYNVEKYIYRCIDSILGQTFTDFELILVDDGSPDNSGVICDKYAEKDNRIRVIHQENAGVSVARNTGLEVSTGTYIAFVDSDDYIEEKYLERLYNCQCDLAICGQSTYDQEYNLLYTLEYDAKKCADKNEINFPDMYKKCMLYSPYCKLFCGSIIRQYRLRFRPHITWGEDGMFVADYLPYVSSVEILPYRGYCYIRYYGGKSLSTKIRPDIIDMITVSREHCIEKIREHAPYAYESVKQVCTEDIYFNCLSFFAKLVKGNTKYAEKVKILSRFLENRYIRQASIDPQRYFAHDSLLQRAVANCFDAKRILIKYKLLCIKKTIKGYLFVVYDALPQDIKKLYRDVKQRVRK